MPKILCVLGAFAVIIFSKRSGGPVQKISSTSKTGLVLSSGFFGFFAHAGFLAAIRELGLVPAAYSGASSGAIVAAMAAAGMSDQAIIDMLLSIKKQDFWDPDPWYNMLKKASQLFRGYTGYLNGSGFGRLLQALPVKRIEGCKTPLIIAATDLTEKKEKLFKKGDMVKALQASGAVPMLFKPVKIKGSLYVDGGIVNKAPVMALADLGGLKRIIVHLVASGNMEEQGDTFLKKKYAPLHIHHLAVNIARSEAYEQQVKMVKMMGIEVKEVKSAAPAVGPDSLEMGKIAYETAKRNSLRILKELEGV